MNRLELHQMLFQCGYTWATRAFITSQETRAVLTSHWSEFLFCSDPHSPASLERSDTIPATGRHIPLSLSISISSQMVAFIIKTLFIRSWPHPENTKLLVGKKRKGNTGVIYLFFFKENEGLHKAGSIWGLASPGSCPARLFPRFPYCHTFCSWCSVQLQALHIIEHNVLGTFCQSDSHA